MCHWKNSIQQTVLYHERSTGLKKYKLWFTIVANEKKRNSYIQTKYEQIISHNYHRTEKRSKQHYGGNTYEERSSRKSRGKEDGLQRKQHPDDPGDKVGDFSEAD